MQRQSHCSEGPVVVVVVVVVVVIQSVVAGQAPITLKWKNTSGNKNKFSFPTSRDTAL